MQRSAAALIAVLAVAGIARADDLDVEQLRRARGLAHELMSPFCPGRTLADCPSANAEPVKAQIRDWVAIGLTDAEIHERLQDEYGDVVEGGPRSQATALLPWILLGMAAVWLGWVIVRLRARGREVEAAAAGDSSTGAQLLQELDSERRD